MAIDALQLGMCAVQREIRLLMIESRRCPGRCVVTVIAKMRKLIELVIGIACIIKIRIMTGKAVIGRILVIAADMTVNTLDGLMGAGQRKIELGMIEGRRRPRIGIMAIHTFVRETIGDMIGIL